MILSATRFKPHGDLEEEGEERPAQALVQPDQYVSVWQDKGEGKELNENSHDQKRRKRTQAEQRSLATYSPKASAMT